MCRATIFTFLLATLHFSNISGQTPVEANGKLKLVGLQLSSECGNPVQLKGMSSHGPQWTANCLEDPTAYTTLQKEWGADIFRIAMYVEESGYLTDTAGYRRFIDRTVDMVEAAGMYCLIDWHILKDGNPMINIEHAKLFWDYMSKKHANKKHILYEICNEPNGKTVNWDTIKSYAETIIPIIRKNDSTSIIVIGTPGWSGQPWSVIGKELTGDIARNVMYTFHFYSATHAGYLPNIKIAVTKLPIFVTEWGGVESSGDGDFNEPITNNFMDIFNGNNTAGVTVSWCNWSFSDVNEGSSVLKPYSCWYGLWNETSPTGEIVKGLMKIPDIKSICTSEPQLFQHPRNVLTKPGRNVYFITKATGDNIKYKWLFSPDSLSWSLLPGKDTSLLILNRVKESDKGFYRSMIYTATDTLFTDVASLKFIRNGPYLGVPIKVPGVIEAEFFDEGDNGVAFYDSDVTNNGGALREGGVDIETTKDTSGVYNIGWITNDEFVTYTVDVERDGYYDIRLRVASNSSTSGEIYSQMNNVEVIPNIPVESTGGWQVWNTISVNNIQLTGGIQPLLVYFSKGGFNLNYIEIVKSNPLGLLEEELGIGLSVFPNPFSDVINIRNNQTDIKGAVIDLIDGYGINVLKHTCLSNDNQINTANLKSGVYMLKITRNNKTTYHKHIKL